MFLPIRSLILALLLLGLAPNAVCASEFNDLVQAAQKARKDGEYLKAVDLLQRAYQIEPDPVLLNNIGKMYQVAGQYRKAYDTYKLVADDPDADSDLRSRDEQRMVNLKPMLNKGHFVIHSEQSVTNVWLSGARIDESVFDVEAQTTPGSHRLEIQEADVAYVTPLTLPAAERSTIDLERQKEMGNVTLKLVDVNGISQITLNSYEVKSNVDKLNTLVITPGLYDIELVFTDNSRYELTRKFSANDELNLQSYASVFSRTQKGTTLATPADADYRYKITAVALGVGLTTAGGFMSYNAHNDTDDILNNDTLTMFQAENRWKDARASGDTGIVLMSLGLTALTSGVLWLMLDNRSAQSVGNWKFGPTLHFQPAFIEHGDRRAGAQISPGAQIW